MTNIILRTTSRSSHEQVSSRLYPAMTNYPQRHISGSSHGQVSSRLNSGSSHGQLSSRLPVDPATTTYPQDYYSTSVDPVTANYHQEYNYPVTTTYPQDYHSTPSSPMSSPRLSVDPVTANYHQEYIQSRPRNLKTTGRSNHDQYYPQGYQSIQSRPSILKIISSHDQFSSRLPVDPVTANYPKDYQFNQLRPSILNII